MNGLNELYILPWPQSRLSPLSLHKYSLPQTTGWGTSLRKVAALHSGLCSLESGDQRYLLRKKQSVNTWKPPTAHTQLPSCQEWIQNPSCAKSLKNCRPWDVTLQSHFWLVKTPACLPHTYTCPGSQECHLLPPLLPLLQGAVETWSYTHKGRANIM